MGVEEVDSDSWVELEYESLAEVEKMEAASATGDLAAAQVVFQLEWLEVSPTERFAIALFSSAYELAIKNEHVLVAQFLTSVGVPFNRYLFRIGRFSNRFQKKYSKRERSGIGTTLSDTTLFRAKVNLVYLLII